MSKQHSNYYTVYREEYSVQDVLEMPGVQEIVEEYADRHKPDGDLGDYEIEVAFEGHLAVVHFVKARY